MKFNMKKIFSGNGFRIITLAEWLCRFFLRKESFRLHYIRRFAGSGKMELQHLNGTSLRYIFHHLCYEFRRDGRS